MESQPKRRRLERSPSPVYNLDAEDDSYDPYVPVAQRRQAKLAKLSSWGVHQKHRTTKHHGEDFGAHADDAEREEDYRREAARKERTLLMEAQEVHSKQAVESQSLYRSTSRRHQHIHGSHRCQEDRQ
jgi:ATP-dependent RNA helicase DDX41